MTTAPDHALDRRPARSTRIRGAAGGFFDALWAAEACVGAGELGLATLALFVAAFVLYGSHIAHGSFYYDDWANAAFTAYPPHPGFAGAVSEYWHMFGSRPLAALYVPTLHEILGLHEHWFIAWSVVLLAAMAATVYLTLRTLGLRPIYAIVISALALVTPFPDATTLWETASTAHLVTILYLLGVVLALRAIDAPTRRRQLSLHLGSLLLFALAVTTYELVATVALCSVLLYLCRTSLRQALARFVADVIVIGLALFWTGSQTAVDHVNTLSNAIAHARLLLTGGLQIIASSIEPFGSPPRAIVLGAAAAILLLGVAAWLLTNRDDGGRRELGRWLVIGVGGVIFAFAAWATFIPADPYYEPLSLGVGNRTNAVAVIGIAVLTVALSVIVGTLLFRRSRHSAVLTAGLTVAVAVAVGLNYGHRTRTDIYNWDQATKVQSQVLSVLHRAIPRPAAGSTLYVFGYTNWTALGVPTFASPWDLNGAVKLLYRNSGIRAYPVMTPAEAVCGRHVVYPVGPGYTTSQFSSRYGRAYLANVAGETASRPLNQSQCNTALGRPARPSS